MSVPKVVIRNVSKYRRNTRFKKKAKTYDFCLGK